MSHLTNEIKDHGSFLTRNVDSVDVSGNLTVTDNGNGKITLDTNAQPDQNLWLTIDSDSGSTSAGTTTDTLNIVGGTGISTSVTGNTLTITNIDPDDELEIQENDSTISTDSTTLNFEGNVSVADEGSGKSTVNIGTASSLGGLIRYSFVDGRKNQWLFLQENDNRPSGPQSNSQAMPGIAPFTLNLVSMVYINSKTGSNTDAEIYINGTLEFTWQIRDAKWAYKTNGLSGITVNPGDQISVFFNDVSGGSDPQRGLLDLVWQITDASTGENSGSTL